MAAITFKCSILYFVPNHDFLKFFQNILIYDMNSTMYVIIYAFIVLLVIKYQFWVKILIHHMFGTK